MKMHLYKNVKQTIWDPADSGDLSIWFVRPFFKKELYITSMVNIESIIEHKQHTSKALFVLQRIIADNNNALASRMREHDSIRITTIHVCNSYIVNV